MTDIPIRPVELLERLADQITKGTTDRDHGIAWTQSDRLNLRTLIPGSDLYRCPVEPDTVLVDLLWDGLRYGYAHNRLFTIALPSGRELLVVDASHNQYSDVIGVIDRHDDHAHIRAFQAAIAGEHCEPLLAGFPSEVELAYGGVVLIDALAEALRNHSYVCELIGDENASWLDQGTRPPLIDALEEELEEADDPEYVTELEDRLARAEAMPTWVWSFDEAVRSKLSALADEQPPIALYAAHVRSAGLDPHDGDQDDELYEATAVLIACEAL